MIRTNTMFEKNGFTHTNNEVLFLIELEGIKEQRKKMDKIPLNLSISIDISGSMEMAVSGYNNEMMWVNKNPLSFLNNERNKELPKRHPSKLDQAKYAAKKAIEKMQDGDYISIVLFSNESEVLVPATQLNQDNREIIIKSLNNIHTKGSTNLHDGWLASATEVAKNISDKSLNRVIVLTDGQTNIGICHPEEISANVKKLQEKLITTTTFGIGEYFNEDLLLEMSAVGGGNFYYIDDDNKLEQMFDEEFSGLKNLAASNIKLNLEFDNDIKIIEQLNKLSIIEKGFLVPDLYNNKKTSLLFKLNLPENINELSGFLNLNYKDENSQNKTETIKIHLNKITEKEWEDMPYNQEVKVQETLLIVANNKIAATKALDIGDMALANDLLLRSQEYVNNSVYLDTRLTEEVGNIDKALLEAQQGKSLRKIIATQSYQTRYSK